MTFRVVILPQAHRDMIRNAGWWAANHSVEQGLRWSDAIYDQIETLADFPESNGLSNENDEFPFEIRDKLVGLGSHPGFRAVFTIREDTVYVLTVRRAAQDVLRPGEVDPPPSGGPSISLRSSARRAVFEHWAEFTGTSGIPAGRPSAGR